MNCNNCGAPMTLFRERDYYHCAHCGVYHFPSQAADGVRLLGENPEGITCSLCQVPLNLATFDDHYRGYQCPRCQGILFTRTAFRQTIEMRRSKAATPPEPPSRAPPEELKRRMACPTCNGQMSTHHYWGPGNIVIDTCSQCDVIWLDYGELSKVVNAPGKDRGAGVRARTELPRTAAKEPKEDAKLGRGLLALLDSFFD